eukprot:4756416-Prymnesium_polylepis.1
MIHTSSSCWWKSTTAMRQRSCPTHRGAECVTRLCRAVVVAFLVVGQLTLPLSERKASACSGWGCRLMLRWGRCTTTSAVACLLPPSELDREFPLLVESCRDRT